MTDRAWVNVFIQGVIFGAFVLFVFFQMYSISFYSKSVEEEACLEQKLNDDYLNKIITENAIEVTSDEQKVNGRGEISDYDYCSLAAQQSAANAAKGGQLSAWITTGLTGVGVMLLYWTLQATRKTLVEAEKTTVSAVAGAKAARDSVRTTEKIGEAQVRAYVVAKNLLIEIPPDEKDLIILHIPLFNSGASPAFNVRINAMVRVAHPDMRLRFPEGKDRKEFGPSVVDVIAAGDTVSQAYPILWHSILDNHHKSIERIMKLTEYRYFEIVVGVIVQYIDVFGKVHAEHAEYSGKVGRAVTGYGFWDDSGNCIVTRNNRSVPGEKLGYENYFKAGRESQKG